MIGHLDNGGVKLAYDRSAGHGRGKADPRLVSWA